jgi:hypothetical protein
MQFGKVTINGNAGVYTQFTTTSTPGVNITVTNSVASHYVYGPGLTTTTAAGEETANRYYYNPATGTQTFANIDPSYLWVRANSTVAGHANYQVQ